MQVIKKLGIGLLMVALSVSSLPIMAGTVKAAERITTDSGVIYEPLNMTDYWSQDTKKAPLLNGYVFGGWYTGENETNLTALKEEELENVPTSNTYAKFVSAEVLSVKTQIDKNTVEGGADRTTPASLRLISGVDSTDYQFVGFDILLNNKKPYLLYGDEPGSTKCYDGLKKSPEDTNIIYPDQYFGAQAKYFNVVKIGNLIPVNDTKIIRVTPYWFTLDGTKVEGISKYVHTEDGYKGYVSVPVYLSTAKQVAAGKLSVSYPENLTLVDDKVEFDGVFTKTNMAFYHDAVNHKINFVGNAETVNELKAAKGIYANLRFTKSDGVSVGNLPFTVSDEEFCDWTENPVTIDVSNFTY